MFGEGPASTRDVMFVGEQPGDQEDLAGHRSSAPPAQMLDRALAEAGIDRARVYVTNAVKHFKWRPQGKRRLHEKPNATEVRACLPWLQAELRWSGHACWSCSARPRHRRRWAQPTRIGDSPGNVVISALAPHVLVTLHPSAILRSETPESREARYARLVEDLAWAARHGEASTAPTG